MDAAGTRDVCRVLVRFFCSISSARPCLVFARCAFRNDDCIPHFSASAICGFVLQMHLIMRLNAILKVTSGAILSIMATPALYTHILFGYESASIAPLWGSSVEIATFVYLLVCLHCGVTTFLSGVSDLRTR
jgi:hypothetical protein